MGSRGQSGLHPPDDRLRTVGTCSVSGYLAGLDCPTAEQRTPRVQDRTLPCPYHERIVVTSDGNFRTSRQCSPDGVAATVFTLPPLRAHFYRRKHTEYSDPPQWLSGCNLRDNGQAGLQLIYPEGSGVLSAVKNWSGELEPFYFAVSTDDESARVFWHLDGKYVRSTSRFHQLSLPLRPGSHTLSVTDDRGNALRRNLMVR